MNQFKPKVSVIIPVYNAEKNLTDCLDSLLAQTYHHYEVICVDDGSTDASLDVLQQYQSKFQRMTIVQQKNKGAGAARNVGILRAGGKYLLFVDADDICYKTLLEKTVEAADNNNADIVCYHFDRLYPNGEKEKCLGYHSQWLLEGGNIFNYESCPDHIMCAVNPTPWNKLFLREFVLQESLRFDEISSTNDISFAAVSCAKAKKLLQWMKHCIVTGLVMLAQLRPPKIKTFLTLHLLSRAQFVK